MQLHIHCGRISNIIKLSQPMGEEKQNSQKCRRCNGPAASDQLCQNCKNELLSNYEASSDWITAYEIEKAQLTASRYRSDDFGKDIG